jgi:hypothetical protein
MAAAFDERITSVVARLTLTSYRFGERQTFEPTPTDMPDGWYLDILKSFTGRENKLSIEENALYALIVPRHCNLYTAYNDGTCSTFSGERNYREAQKVYNLYGKPENFRITYRTGVHSTPNPADKHMTQQQRSQNID